MPLNKTLDTPFLGHAHRLIYLRQCVELLMSDVVRHQRKKKVNTGYSILQNAHTVFHASDPAIRKSNRPIWVARLSSHFRRPFKRSRRCRVYLTGQIGGLDSSLRSIKRASVISSKPRDSPIAPPADNEHPGPIFLRNVVNRRFKYRWLILAASGFTCMTVITVVSVVYSNR